MADCCEIESDSLNRSQRKTLVRVLIINAVMFVAVLVAALYAKSSALLSGTIDNLGDAITYGLSLYAVSRGARYKAKVALIKGFLILFAALMVCVHVFYKLKNPEIPIFEVMGIMTLFSLLANVLCLSLLWKHRREDINMASVWECSRNDVIENLSVLVATVAIWASQSQWPDILVAGILIIILLRSALGIIRKSYSELKKSEI